MQLDKYSHINLPSGNIRLAITNGCNMNCFYCHNEGQSSQSVTNLGFEGFLEIIKIASKFGLRGITFSGGEPLLNKDFERMVDCCINIGLEKIDVCTNGILIPQYIKLLSSSPKIDVAVGIDTCNPEVISKQSALGKPFGVIEQNILLLKKHNIKYSINTVYTGHNEKEVFAICDYCIKHKINIRLIEMDTKKYLTSKILTDNFEKFISDVIQHFQLKKGCIHPGKGFMGVAENGSVVSFYDAYCHNRDCRSCALWTMRIDARGEIIPCYAKNLRIPLLGISEKQQQENFLMGLYNLGISPESKTIKF